jgi:peptide/nickel transport system permease protein|tara:strand:+ start:2921 stop:3865 length:945 start_codon:yes stop_codon:yes gene_type:complete
LIENQSSLAKINDLAFRIVDSDLFYSFSRNPIVVVSAVITFVFIIAATFAPWLAPHNPFDPASLDLMEASTPPVWLEDGMSKFMLGTDDQGRDILSTIMFGSRVSLIVGFSAVLFSVFVGVGSGLLAGYLGGWLDTVIMRLADVQLAIPAILIALMINGVVAILLPPQLQHEMAIYVLILAIGVSDWPRYARVTRGSVLVERNKEYVAAAQVIGVHPLFIMLRHVLPNIMGPVLVMATIGLALAIITEATLSFLGVGVPPTTPSLGTMIRVGNNYLFSGEWWITFFPCTALVTLVLAVNLMGDWLRDALNPKLR